MSGQRGSSKPPHACVFGLGWGDEGKGKIVDLLCPSFRYVVRFNGGANAGHTVRVGDQTFALHLLPSGVLHGHVTAVIGPGVVVDPIKLIAEIDALTERGVDVSERLVISDRSHLVLAYHQIEDRLSEEAASSSTRLGTTSRGIGPCYADKMRRSSALRMCDLLGGRDVTGRLREIVQTRRRLLATLYGEDGGLDEDQVIRDWRIAGDRLHPFIGDTTSILHEAVDRHQPILFEGANGALLDVDHGTYPFVTSSSTGPHGIGSGAGVPASRVNTLIGTIKAYATRVGSGPFVTELKDEIGERIRREGHEFGTTTGRPRRCGWFDAVACRYGVRITGATDIALMHLDTLSGFPRVGVCVGYRTPDGTVTTEIRGGAGFLEQVEPVMEYLSGWSEPLGDVRRYSDLPSAARAYVSRIESLIGAPVHLVGIGPDRAQTLSRGALSDWVHIPEATGA